MAATSGGRPRPSLLFRTAVAALRPVMRTLTRREWSGAEHLPDGPFVIAANHLSMFDPLCVGHFCVDHGVYPRAMAKESLFRMPVVGTLMRGAGAIPVRRGTSDAAGALVEAERALGEGDAILMFPEGTTTQDPDLWPMRARTGLARLALRTGVPVVPVAQWGAQRVIPASGRGFHPWPPAPVQVVAGEPVALADLRHRADDPLAWDEATSRVMRRLTDQLAGIRGVPPPAEPYLGRPVH